MSRLLVPGPATRDTVNVWLAATLEPPGALDLVVGADQPRPVGAAWREWQSHGRTQAWTQRVEVGGLEPGRSYPVRLIEDGVERATASAATLPDALPDISQPPFICLLGSCFSHLGDEAGAAGAAFAGLPAGARPTVKFLCGDQVYLDAPFPRFLINNFGRDDLQAELLSTYLATWSQAGDLSGFSELLRSGSTWFQSDDHEIWNNAPSPTATVRATWWPLGDHGAAWLSLATELYDGFQTTARSSQFDVGQLSFFVLDTRLARRADRTRFVEPQRMAEVVDWLAGLAGPGVLVVGQPIFSDRAGWKGNLTDWGLVDYDQYAELVRALMAASHDVLLLTGDVHYGRVAGCTLPSGASLIEVISSPIALVDPRVGGTWHEPPGMFPAFTIPGVVQAPIWFAQDHRLAANQFATLEFSAQGSRVHVAVRSWPIPSPGEAPTSSVVLDRLIQ